MVERNKCSGIKIREQGIFFIYRVQNLVNFGRTRVFHSFSVYSTDHSFLQRISIFVFFPPFSFLCVKPL